MSMPRIGTSGIVWRLVTYNPLGITGVGGGGVVVGKLVAETVVVDGLAVGCVDEIEAELIEPLETDEITTERVAVLGGGNGVVVGAAGELQAAISETSAITAMLVST
jgi:hypothetical protein